jgi:hypothetical protein
MTIFMCVGYFTFIFLKESASLVFSCTWSVVDRQTTRKGKQTDTHARNSKINEEKQNKKHKWKHAKRNHVQEKNQQSRFLQEYESKISYTPEDGHVGRNM